MSDAPAPRTGRSGGIFVAVLVAGSAVAVGGWYLLTNRGGAAIDGSGFDLSAAPAHRPAAVASASPLPQAPVSSLGMMKADENVSFSGPAGPAPAPGAAAKPAGGAPATKTEEAHMGFIEAARRHEADVQRWAMKMTNKYAVVRQYGKDWMSYPDLRKLNDDYARNHDPIAFMVGLSHAPNLGTMMKKYAGIPEMRDVVMNGMKESPPELTASALEVVQNDRTMKDLVSNIAGGMGLPPTVTAMINGGGDPSKMDQTKMANDVMNTPELQKALQQSQVAPVALPK